MNYTFLLHSKRQLNMPIDMFHVSIRCSRNIVVYEIQNDHLNNWKKYVSRQRKMSMKHNRNELKVFYCQLRVQTK